MSDSNIIPFRINRESNIPLNNQIKEHIRGQIYAGHLKPGDQLPTIKDLARALSVNFNTIALAYRDLATQGVLVSARGQGTFVAAPPRENAREQQRREKLQTLVNALLKEADRLGYTPEEVWQTIQTHFNR
jgi:DNA-binding transcriptional regulator YhcF (GntR family)